MFEDMRSFVIILLALLCGLSGMFFSKKAEKNGKKSFLIVAAILAILCVIGIIAAVISMVIAKKG